MYAFEHMLAWMAASGALGAIIGGWRMRRAMTEPKQRRALPENKPRPHCLCESPLIHSIVAREGGSVLVCDACGGER